VPPKSAVSPLPPAPPFVDEPRKSGPEKQAAAARAAPARQAEEPLAGLAKPESGMLRLTFPFAAPTAAAVFRRADTLWLVFDTDAPIDLARIKREAGRAIVNATATRDKEGQIVRLKLDRPYLSGAALDGRTWTVSLGDTVPEPGEPLALARLAMSPGHTSAAIDFAEPHSVHMMRDPDLGDRLIAVTGFAPTRGLPKTQEFVEFRALSSTQGLAIEPLADDLVIEAASGRVLIARPGGLTLTPAAVAADPRARLHPVALDVQSWGADLRAEFLARRAALMSALSDAPEIRRNAVRMDIARFYLAREMYPEAKGALDVVIAGERDNHELARALVLRAIAALLMERPQEALEDLKNPAVGDQNEARLWRALALSRLGRFAQAREGLQSVAAASANLPVELQRVAIGESVRCAVEVGDFAEAARQLNDFDMIGTPPEMKGAIAMLSGRVAEGLGKISDALSAYTVAADSHDASIAAEGRLRQMKLRHAVSQTKPEDAIADLERLTTAWRGDRTELEALQLLAALYTEADRFRDAFQVMKVATTVYPNAPITQRIQNQAAKTFEAIFLGASGERLPPTDTLALFYDFRSLTPPGRRGDEMIRRLAERLVSMDLLQQAGELLQHQIDHRLKGATRAEVAARLATIYLMNRKPDRALSALRLSRMSDLPSELRQKRLLLEARALSDTGRHDLALEIIQDMSGREVERLRADIHWNARHWRLAAEHIERLYGERWQQFAPLDATERSDVLRAAIGYALADDMIGLDRFRQKYAAKMADGPERRLFEVLTAPLNARGEEFAQVAKSAASLDTLGAFLRDMRERYPEPGDKVSAAPPPERG
jgi:tetratricopeptide (TPR) repeat protein